MYLDEHELLNGKLDILSGADLHEFLNQIFPDRAPVARRVRDDYHNYSMSNGALLAYIGTCITIPELSNLFGRYFSARGFVNNISGGIDAKYFKSYSMPDMNGRKGYVLTKYGFDMVGGVPRSIAFRPFKDRKKWVPKPHVYGTGLSLFALMAARVPFVFDKEYSFSVSRGSGSHKYPASITPDAVIAYTNEQGASYYVYLEQDTGNEVDAILEDKIPKYEINGLLDPGRGCILFSFHNCSPLPTCDTYDIDMIIRLSDEMYQSGCYDLRGYYEQEKNNLPIDRLVYLKKMMVRVGLCVAVNIVDGKKVLCDVEGVGADTILYFDDYGTVDDNGYFAKRFCKEFTETDLVRYKEDIHLGCNPYRMIHYNKGSDMKLFLGRRKALWNSYAKQINRGNWNTKKLFSLTHGFSIYLAPSTLLNKVAPLFLPSNTDFEDKCYRFLDSYYPGVSSYGEFKAKLNYAGNGLVFKYVGQTENSLIAVEHIGYDLGGFVRAYCAYRAAGSAAFLDGKKLHLVLVCNTERDIEEFCLVTRYAGVDFFEPDLPFAIYFLMQRDVDGNGDGLLRSGRYYKDAADNDCAEIIVLN